MMTTNQPRCGYDRRMGKSFDLIIIGGGHAGAEAAWAASHLGAKTALVTLDPARIGQMSCNPAIGGLAKGQIVREIDALGGLMGRATDATGIQFRMLNLSKGPAVWGPRAQADKYKYAAEVQRLLNSECRSLEIITGEAVEILTTHQNLGGDRPRVVGVMLAGGQKLTADAVMVTTGTFLRGLMHTGQQQTAGGRVGEPAPAGLSASLASLGLELGRLKTGTPPRLDADSIDFDCLERQDGDPYPAPFSYLHEYAAATPWHPPLPQRPCYITATTAAVHDLIRANLHRAPMYSGQISSTGPRYCPSIEDKIVRFADKSSHHIFLEPEGLDTNEIYCNGISTSLPAEVQAGIIEQIPGLEKARILRHGYAVEYDMVWPTQIKVTLETKKIAGLFLAGQINGTSGYEEAAAQGLVAAVNAVRYLNGPSDQAGCDDEADAENHGYEPFVLGRDQAYIGVLIDDLVTKPPTEPYRMFTSRAEHRLHLRTDNADLRLTPIGRSLGLVDEHRWTHFSQIQSALAEASATLAHIRIGSQAAHAYLQRSDAQWNEVLAAASGENEKLKRIDHHLVNRLLVDLKYGGYIRRQDAQIARARQLESKVIPDSIDYATVIGLRNEARHKFQTFTPRSLGQALRISGITPADVTVLAIHLARDSRPVQRPAAASV